MVVGDASLGLDLPAGGDYFEGRGVGAPKRVREGVAFGVAGGDGAADVLVRAGVLVDLPCVRRAVEAHSGGLGVGHGRRAQEQGHDC